MDPDVENFQLSLQHIENLISLRIILDLCDITERTHSDKALHWVTLQANWRYLMTQKRKVEVT